VRNRPKARGAARGPTVAKRRDQKRRAHALERDLAELVERDAAVVVRVERRQQVSVPTDDGVSRQETSRAGRLVGATRNAAITVGIPVLCVAAE